MYPATGSGTLELTTSEGQSTVPFTIGYGAYRLTSGTNWFSKRLETVELRIASREFAPTLPGQGPPDGNRVTLHIGVVGLDARQAKTHSFAFDAAQTDPPGVVLTHERKALRFSGGCQLAWRHDDGAVEFKIEAEFMDDHDARAKLSLTCVPSVNKPNPPTFWAHQVMSGGMFTRGIKGRVVAQWIPGATGYRSKMLVDRDFIPRFVYPPDSYLDIAGNPCITDEVFFNLKHAARHFGRLSIHGTAIDGRRFDLLAGWPRLQVIEGSRSRVNDAGMAALGECRSLRIVELTGCPLTERCYESARAVCRKLPELRVLLLNQTGLSDDCLLELDQEFPDIRFWSK